jgi:hypothetical protein
VKKLGGSAYELTFSYADDADLDDQVHDLLCEISRAADLRSCCIETDMHEKGTERSW